MKLLYFVNFLLLATFASAQVINFPDPAFKSELLINNPTSPVGFDQSDNYIQIDADGNGEIEQSEALAVYKLHLFTTNINDLSGIEYFENLSSFLMSTAPITSIDVSSLSNLTYFRCNYTALANVTLNSSIEIVEVDHNQLSALDISGCPSLSNLQCQNNMLTVLDLSNNPNLLYLNCGHNQLPALNVTPLTDLRYLSCDNNMIMALDIEPLHDLERLDCNNNQLTSLAVTGKTNLERLYCSHNSISELDMTDVGSAVPNFGFFGLFELVCAYNDLTSIDTSVMGNETKIWADVSFNTNLTFINIKNGVLLEDSIPAEPPLPASGIYFEGTPNLQYICTDEYNLNYMQQKVAIYGYSNCVVNSYCTFTPGENYFVIGGQSTYDLNNNGCDETDPTFAGLQYNISDGTSTRTFFFDQNGNYSVAALQGTHVLTPIFENPAFFTAVPESITVTFPGEETPFTQNFCIVANGNHADVEVLVLPLNAARPGFDSHYQVLLKNNGNLMHNGTVTFSYGDDIHDVIDVTPASTSSANNALIWDFINLVPYETRTYNITLNLNSPTETPAVNGGDVLTIGAAVVIAEADEFPENNTHQLNQTVVNSLDPNDIVCLEGETVGTDIVGEYVHYLIRFENVGTASAQNIVVRDQIDAGKFDISSLKPLSASHTYETRISSENLVEFIFENINLPFNDANNDGYVGFKIKTLPTLAIGDTFTQQASIFFDYNFPILTNNESTTITALAAAEFETEKIKIYPNPAGDRINIEYGNGIEIQTLHIYNLVGQIVLSQSSNLHDAINVSSLQTGHYFIKLESAQGTATEKFIKL